MLDLAAKTQDILKFTINWHLVEKHRQYDYKIVYNTGINLCKFISELNDSKVAFTHSTGNVLGELTFSISNKAENTRDYFMFQILESLHSELIQQGVELFSGTSRFDKTFSNLEFKGKNIHPFYTMTYVSLEYHRN